MRFRTVGMLAVVALVLASCGGGVPEAAGPSEGIQVHGEWTIDIYNEDGSLDRHVEFSNSLRTRGQQLLVNLLTGARSAGGWEIEFGENAFPASICPSTTSGKCKVAASASAVDTDSVGFEETVRLAGSATIEADGTVESVETRLGACLSNTAPDDCFLTGGAFVFTAKTFALEPDLDFVPVTAGQTVQIQVDISFTSG